MSDLAPLIEQVVEIVKGTKDFAVAQAPDFVRQFVIYSYIDTVGWLLFNLVALAAAIGGIMYLRHHWDDLQDLGQFLGSTGVLVVGGFSSFGTIANIDDLISLYFAPKVYIVMHIASCLNAGKQ